MATIQRWMCSQLYAWSMSQQVVQLSQVLINSHFVGAMILRLLAGNTRKVFKCWLHCTHSIVSKHKEDQPMILAHLNMQGSFKFKNLQLLRVPSTTWHRGDSNQGCHRHTHKHTHTHDVGLRKSSCTSTLSAFPSKTTLLGHLWWVYLQEPGSRQWIVGVRNSTPPGNQHMV